MSETEHCCVLWGSVLGVLGGQDCPHISQMGELRAVVLYALASLAQPLFLCR
jgi:hypothetical protein